MTQDAPTANRTAEFDVDPLFIHRWSPRAMSGEPVSQRQLMTLFEAAKWAPSCFNEQPWRFLYARRDTDHWDTFFGLLVEANQQWCANAAALVVIASKKTFTRNGNPNPTHSYDAGAAWVSLALQGSSMGLVVHGMAGFDYAAAAEQLKVPDDYKIEAMAAIGQPAGLDQLPERFHDGEVPSQRRPLADLVMEGGFTSV